MARYCALSKRYFGKYSWMVLMVLVGLIPVLAIWLSTNDTNQTVKFNLVEPIENTEGDPYSKALKQAKILHNDQLTAKLYQEAVDYFRGQNNIEKEAKYKSEFGKWLEESGQTKEAIWVYQELAFSYASEHQFTESIALYSKIGDLMRRAAVSRDQIANNHHNLAMSYLELGDPKQAYEQLNQALMIYADLHMDAKVAKTYDLIALTCRVSANWDCAEWSQALALKGYILLAQPKYIADSYVKLGYIYKEKKDSDQGCRAWSEAYRMLQDRTISMGEERDIILADIEKQLKSDFCGRM